MVTFATVVGVTEGHGKMLPDVISQTAYVNDGHILRCTL